MSIGQREAILFVLDCSKHMGVPRSFTEGAGENEVTSMVTPLEVMVRIINTKLAQRILRGLATTPAGVITYAVAKTQNVLRTRALTTAQENGKQYDKSKDPYRNFYEEVKFNARLDVGILGQINGVMAGQGPDGEREGEEPNLKCADAHSALILAVETLDAQPKIENYKREVYLLTDGESKGDWDNWESTAERYNVRKVGLHVIGMDFDDQAMGYKERDKSDIKAENEDHLHFIVDKLSRPSSVTNAARALDIACQPILQAKRSITTKMELSLGDIKNDPERALSIKIEVKKATTVEAVRSMKKMSTMGYEKLDRPSTQSQSQQFVPLRPSNQPGTSQSQSQHPATQEASSMPPPSRKLYQMGNIGQTLEKMLAAEGLGPTGSSNEPTVDAVSSTSRQYYKDVDAPTGPGRREDEEEDDDPKVSQREVRNSETPLVDAYFYGGDRVDSLDVLNSMGMQGMGGNQTGMQIVGFIKKENIRYEWRMGDVLYVYASSGYTGSQLVLSALLNAMDERNSVAIVRYVRKGMMQGGVYRIPDPRMGILCPRIENGREFAHFCPLPFAEDVRDYSFASLTNIFNRHNDRLEVHKFLPTKEQNAAMSQLVDAMDYTDPSNIDEDSVPASLYKIEESYSPAIHNINHTLLFRMSNPDGDIPPIPESIMRYMQPFPHVVERAASALAVASMVFDVNKVPAKPKQVRKNKRKTEAIDFEEDDNMMDFLSRDTPLDAAPPRKSSFKPLVNFSFDSDGDEDVPPVVPPPVIAPHPPSPVQAAIVIDKYEDDVKPALPEEEEDDDDPEPDTESEEEDAIIIDGPKSISTEQPLVDFVAVSMARGAVAAVREMGTTVGKLLESSRQDLAVQCLRVARESVKGKPYAIAYNVLLDSISPSSKAGILARLKMEDLGPLVGAGAGTLAEANAFFASS